jgi:arylformamidase
MAIAGDKTVKCEIISSGQKYKGDCIFKPQNAGTFTLTNTSQNYNHFEMPETIANPHGILGNLVLKQMKLI